MTNQKIIKMKMGRRRFIKTQQSIDPSAWLNDLDQLKSNLLEQTQLQVTGTETYFRVEGGGIYLMKQVLGPPLKIHKLDQRTLETVDQEASDLLVYPLDGLNLFTTNFEAIQKKAESLHFKLKKSGKLQFLIDTYDIVFDEEKIEVHFFDQKDYIQG